LEEPTAIAAKRSKGSSADIARGYTKPVGLILLARGASAPEHRGAEIAVATA
jgi:hypothetical protein